MPMLGTARSLCRLLVSRSEERPKAQLYAFGLRQPIPPFTLPLRQGETEPLLALQPLLHRMYDRARLELAINYQRLPSHKLSNEDWEWLQSFIGAE